MPCRSRKRSTGGRCGPSPISTARRRRPGGQRARTSRSIRASASGRFVRAKRITLKIVGGPAGSRCGHPPPGGVDRVGQHQHLHPGAERTAYRRRGGLAHRRPLHGPVGQAGDGAAERRQHPEGRPEGVHGDQGRDVAGRGPPGDAEGERREHRDVGVHDVGPGQRVEDLTGRAAGTGDRDPREGHPGHPVRVGCAGPARRGREDPGVVSLAALLGHEVGHVGLDAAQPRQVAVGDVEDPHQATCRTWPRRCAHSHAARPTPPTGISRP